MVSDKENVPINDLIVVKRSGQRVDFNSMKIAIAIKKSFDQVFPDNSYKMVNEIYEDVLNYIRANYMERKTINVEDIQDIIENILKENNCLEVYKAFSEYRMRRAISRKAFNLKQQHKFTKAIERIMDQSKEEKSTASPNEILLDFGKTIASEYTKTYVLDNKLVRAHEEGNIYIHNLDYFHLGKLSDTHVLLNSKTFCDFSRKFIFEGLNVKEEIDGEVAIDALDYQLKSGFLGIFKKNFLKNLTDYLKVTDYLDYININKISEMLSRENTIDIDLELFNQFILNDKVKNIFEYSKQVSLDDTKILLKQLLKDLLINLNQNYYENSKFAISLGTRDDKLEKIIVLAYLEVLDELPYLVNITTIFKISKKSSKELLSVIGKNICLEKNIALSFVDTSYNLSDGECVEYFSSGKRIFENSIYEEKRSTGRMIVASVSINMSRIGFKCIDKSLKEFYQELDNWLEMARVALINIFEEIGSKNKDNYRVIFNGNILDDDKLEYGQKIRKILKKGVLNLELAGLTECVMNLEVDTTKQKKLVIEILKYVKEKCYLYSKESKLNFVVSETSKKRPLEKLMALDKAIYGIKKGITDKDCYGRIDGIFKFKKDIHDDLHFIGKYQELLLGGNLVIITLNKNTNVKDILNIIKIAEEENVGFLKLEIRK